MARLIKKINYPCGLKIHEEGRNFSLMVFLFSWLNLDDEEIKLCPLHGKKCKR